VPQAVHLKAKLQLYEGSILRVTLDEKNGVEKRFRVSGIPDFAVMED
jgi:hypothetical protein